MTKRQLAVAISERMDVPIKDAVEFLEAFIEIVGDTVADGETVTITNFAKFWRKDVPAKKARKGINPFTKEEQMFKAKPATKAVKITALKGLKDKAAASKRKKK